jgi:putative ABC transport system permease protein
MLRSFDSLALRQLRTRRMRVALTGFGIVLGVGMVFAVLLLVGTIRASFDDLISSAWGKTDLIAMSQSGGQIPESKYQQLRTTPGVKSVAPMVGGLFQRLGPDGRAVKGLRGRMMVAGVDPKNAPYDLHFTSGRTVSSGNEIVVEKGWASKFGLHAGDVLRVAGPRGRQALRVVGIFRFSNSLGFGDQGLAMMPMAAARAQFDLPTGYMQLSIRASDRTQVAALKQRVSDVLGTGVDVRTPQGYSNEIAKQFQGLNVVLYFFSGVALFVGGFLILNSFNMTVLQRMREIGMLRTLGATRGMVTRTVLTEALLIGAIGTVLGLGLGLLLSGGLIAFMKGLGLPIGPLKLSLGAAITAIVVGVVVTTAGALYPARRAGRVSPMRAVLGGAHIRRTPRRLRLVAGVALFVPGLILGGSFWMSDSAGRSALSAIGGIALTMAMFLGMALVAPWLIMPLVRMFAAPGRKLFPASARLADDSVRRNPTRTAATAIALTIGLSVIVTNSVLSGSFLGTINDQIDATYARDFTISAQGTTLQTGGQSIAPAVRAKIAAVPGVALVTPLRLAYAKLPNRQTTQPGVVEGVDPARWGAVDRTPVVGATRAAALRGLAAGGIIAGRSYASAANLHVGSRVRITGAAGTRTVPVVGILNASVAGLADSMQVSLATLRDVYGITGDTQLVIKAVPGADRPAVERRIDALLTRSYPNLEVQSIATTKDQIKSQINQQFNLFNGILVIAILVSLLGVVNTLAMSVVERTREIGVLRALGASRWQVRRTMLDESLLITAAGALAGVALGALIGWVWVQGLDSFLPGISFRFPAAITATIAVIAVVLGVIAAIVPARRAANLDPISAIGYE